MTVECQQLYRILKSKDLYPTQVHTIDRNNELHIEDMS
jgi:hypothetical protein